MKRLIVMCMALLLAFAPVATAEAAKGGKSKGAAKTCVAKKTAKGKKAKKAKKACAKKAKKAKKVKKAPAASTEAALAKRDCRDEQHEDPESFVADFGSGAAALARCAAELLGEGSDDERVDEGEAAEPLENEPADEEPFDAGDEPGTEDAELV